jgi:hypothetical protein
LLAHKLRQAEQELHQLEEAYQTLEDQIPDYEAVLEEFIREEMPIRLVAYGLKSPQLFRDFFSSRAVTGEDIESCYERVLKEEFLVPALYRDLLMQNDPASKIFKTIGGEFPTQESKETESLAKSKRAFE